MRLTLRTLLAYLDDILPASEAKEIGEKIAATPAASQLTERVRDVMRRRRLTAPAPDGSGGGIDPNLISEYLDNSLPPNLVSEVERLCLASDVNLAEVAACHQILTLVRGEPVAISGRLRERMYALGPQGTPLEVPDAPPASKNVRETNAREQMAAMQAAGQSPRPASAPPRTLESRLPDYLRKPPLWKRMLPWAAIALIAILWLGLLYGDPSLFGIRETADQENAPQAEKLAQADQAAGPDEPAPAPEDVPPVAAPVAPEPVRATETEPPIDPPPPAEETPILGGESPPAVVEPSAMKPPGDAVANASKPEDSPLPPSVEAAETGTTSPSASKETPEPAEEAPQADETPITTPVVTIASRQGVPLYRREDSELWYPIPRGESPPVGAPLAVPVPFTTDLSIGDLSLNFELLGGTRLTPLGDNQAAALGIDLSQGRVRVTSKNPQSADLREMRFGLRLGNGLWRIEPLSSNTALGIVAQPLRPAEVGQDLSSETPQGIIYVPRGSIRLSDSNGHVQIIEAGGRVVLTPGESAGNMVPLAELPSETLAVAVADAEKNAASEGTDEAEAAEDVTTGDQENQIVATVAPKPKEALAQTETPQAGSDAVPGTLPAGFPAWVVPQERTAAATRALETFASVFLSGRPADESLLPEINNRYFFVAEPAANALALIENVDGMLKTLRDADLYETRMAAFQGLRNWLGRSTEHGEELRQRLQVVFARDDLVQTLNRLLWGFDMEDARDLETSQQLVAWLDHPERVVRELAFYYVKQLSGRTFDYRPSLIASRRASSLNRWRDFVNRNGGLVVGE